MKTFFKYFLNFLCLIYFAQFWVSFFSDDANKWTRWMSIELHGALICVCVFFGAAKWAYERINNNK